MRVFEFAKPLTLQQAREKGLKQQARDLQVRMKKERLHKQRQQAADTAQSLAKLQSQTL
jgi:hypothetical protein